ncbi:MAG: type II toxin-antitoxin system VapC family toxin [Promethearchaeota archaeon]
MSNEKNTVIIDSNFILLPFQFRIDFLREISDKLEGKTRFIVFEQIIKELEAKKKREPKKIKFQLQLQSGLAYLEKFKESYNISFKNILKSFEETTDDFLLRACSDYKKKYKNVYLATNDSELRKRAKIAKINTIFLRQKKFLHIERT